MTERRAHLEAGLFLLAVAVGFILLCATTVLAQDGGVAMVMPAAEVAKGFDWGGLFGGNPVAWLGGIALAALGGFKWLSAQRKRIIAKLVYRSYFIAEDLANEIEGPDVFDKMSAALKALDQMLVLGGWRVADGKEIEAAKLQISSMHGESVMAKGLVAKSP